MVDTKNHPTPLACLQCGQGWTSELAVCGKFHDVLAQRRAVLNAGCPQCHANGENVLLLETALSPE